MLLTSAILYSCFDSANSGGGGVDVPNSIQGRIVPDSGCRAENAQVLIRPNGWTPLDGKAQKDWNTTVSSSGTFSMPIPDTGKWILEVRDTTGKCGLAHSFAASDIRNSQDGAITGLRLQKSGSIQGHLVAYRGVTTSDPTTWTVVIPGLDVAVKPDTAGLWVTNNIPPGKFEPVAAPPPAGKVPPSESTPLGDATVQVGTPVLLPPSIVGVPKSDNARILQGRALSSANQPASKGGFVLTPLSGTTEAKILAQFDDSGRFAITLPDSGNWLLQARFGSEIFTDSIRSSDLSTGLGNTKSKYDTIHLIVPGSISGSILLPIGQNVAPDSLSAWTISVVGTNLTTTTDRAGHYRFPELAPGSYSLQASSAAGTVALGAATVQPGQASALQPKIIPPTGANPSAQWIVGKVAAPVGYSDGDSIVAISEEIGSVNAQSPTYSYIESYTSLKGTTDSSGGFVLQKDSTKTFRLIIRSKNRLLGASLDWGAKADTQAIANVTLQPLGSIRLHFQFPSSIPYTMNFSGFQLSLLGTHWETSNLGPNGAFELDSLPAGKYNAALIDYNSGRSLPFKITLQIRPGATLDSTIVVTPAMFEDSTTWAKTARLKVSLPSALSETVHGFPMRIRLDSLVDFNASTSNGSDVRVLDSKGNWLPVWMSRWNAAAKQADAWVRIDSVAKTDSIVLTVRLGNANAYTLSNSISDSVFRKSDGWIAAWSGTSGRDLTGGGSTLALNVAGTDTGIDAPTWKFGTSSSIRANLPGGSLSNGYTAMAMVRLGAAPSEGAKLISMRSDNGAIAEAFSFGQFSTNSIVEENQISQAVNASYTPGRGGAQVFITFPSSEWVPAVLSASPDTFYLGRLNNSDQADLHPLQLPAQLKFGAGPEIVFGSPSSSYAGIDGSLGDIRIFAGKWSDARNYLEARNWEATPSWHSWR